MMYQNIIQIQLLFFPIFFFFFYLSKTTRINGIKVAMDTYNQSNVKFYNKVSKTLVRYESNFGRLGVALQVVLIAPRWKITTTSTLIITTATVP